MTNAQAALIAAATYHANNEGVDVIQEADYFKKWLDRTDAADQQRIKVG